MGKYGIPLGLCDECRDRRRDTGSLPAANSATIQTTIETTIQTTIETTIQTTIENHKNTINKK